MNTPKVLSVQALENKRLLVQFGNSAEKIYNCKPIMEKFEPFEILENEVFFKQVQMHTGGYATSWNNKVDSREYEL
ncbi:MAG TPA: hypothetical protein VF918_10765 [Anaerolineales bacterium]